MYTWPNIICFHYIQYLYSFKHSSFNLVPYWDEQCNDVKGKKSLGKFIIKFGDISLICFTLLIIDALARGCLGSSPLNTHSY